MNKLKVQLNAFRNENSFTIEGEQSNTTGYLSDFVRIPLLVWADKFYTEAYSELNEDYQVEITASPFEQIFLEDLLYSLNKYESFMSCKTKKYLKEIGDGNEGDYFINSYVINTSIDDRYKKAISIAKGLSVENYRLRVCWDENCELKKEEFLNDLVKFVPLENGQIFVASKKETRNIVRSIKNISENEAIVLVPSDNDRLVPLANGKYVWEVKQERFSEIYHLIIEYFVKIRTIREIRNILLNNAIYEDIQDELIEISAVDTILCVKKIAPIGVGFSGEIELYSKPEGFTLPEVKFVTKNQNIIKIDGKKVTGLEPGTAYIDVFQKDSIIRVAELKVEVYIEKAAKNIYLSLPANGAKLGSVAQIKVSADPVDASDIHNLTWSSSNTSVATIGENGILHPISAGTTVVKAKGKFAECEIVVDVPPYPVAIEIYINGTKTDVIEFRGDEEIEIEARYVPANSSPSLIDLYYDGINMESISNAGAKIKESSEKGSMSIKNRSALGVLATGKEYIDTGVDLVDSIALGNSLQFRRIDNNKFIVHSKGDLNGKITLIDSESGYKSEVLCKVKNQSTLYKAGFIAMAGMFLGWFLPDFIGTVVQWGALLFAAYFYVSKEIFK